MSKACTEFALGECEGHFSLPLGVRSLFARLLACWLLLYRMMENPRNICARPAVPLGLKQQVKIMSFQKEYNVTHIAGSHPVCEITLFVCTCATWPQRGNSVAFGFFYRFFFFFFFKVFHLNAFFPSRFLQFMFSLLTCRNIYVYYFCWLIQWEKERLSH